MVILSLLFFRFDVTRIIPSSDGSSTSSDLSNPAKKRRIHKDYVLVKTFSSSKHGESEHTNDTQSNEVESDETNEHHQQNVSHQSKNASDLAKEAIATDNMSYYYKNSSDKGIRVTYRCKFVKSRGAQCEADGYLLYDSKNDDVHYYRSVNEHTHDNHPNAVNKISTEVEAVIREMYEVDHIVKPSSILYNLGRKGMTLPSQSQLQTVLKRIRGEKFGQEKIHLGTLEKWLAEHTVVPSEDTEPYVVDYVIRINESKPDESEFRFLISSKKLLEAAINVDKIHTDATYKLIWQGFPVLLVGTTDMYRQFHIFGIAVCTTETAVDFAFVFNAVNKGVDHLFGAQIRPKFLICDASSAIANGCHNVYGGQVVVIMCWAHMRRAFSKKIKTFIKDKKKENELLYDLDKLQLSRSDDAFNRAADLFVSKWEQESQDLMEYFTNEWLVKHRFWYEGVAQHIPSSNNAQEATHKAIKDKHTIRQRFDLGRFREVLFQMIKQYSCEYTYGIREVHRKPLIDLPVWTEAYNWARANTTIKITKLRDRIVHEIPLESNLNVDIDDTLIYESFDNFKKYYFSKCITTFSIPFNKSTWEKGFCDCADFFKLFICKHVVGIALRMKFTEAPLEAKNIPIGQKRKKGRPALAKAAFIVQ